MLDYDKNQSVKIQSGGKKVSASLRRKYIRASKRSKCKGIKRGCLQVPNCVTAKGKRGRYCRKARNTRRKH